MSNINVANVTQLYMTCMHHLRDIIMHFKPTLVLCHFGMQSIKIKSCRAKKQIAYFHGSNIL